MKTPSEPPTEWDDLRARIIGLGERSIRKSYYPELEQRLVELERFRALLDQSNDLIFLVQIPSGGFADVNESACQQLELSREAILGMSIGDLVPASVFENMAALFAEKDQTDPAGVTIVTAFRSNGRELPVEMSVRLVSFKDAVYAVIVARDVTERMQAEEALRESEERYRLIAENTADTIAVFDLSLRPTYISPSITKLRGYSVQEAMAQSLDQILTPESLQRAQEAFANQIALEASGKADRSRTDLLKLEEYCKDGSTIWVELAASFLRGEDSNPTGILTVTRDITERKQAEEEHQAHLWFFESLDSVNRAMQGTNDLEQVMKDVLDSLLSVFECDRAWLVYPCDPEAATWQVPMERTTPEFPSILPIGVELPLEPAGAEVYRILRGSTGPVTFSPESEHPVPLEIAGAFSVQSFIAMAFYPKIGKPWSFGLHQCSYARDWTAAEERLFQEIGRRLSDTLTSLLAYRNLQENETQIKQLVDFSPVAMAVTSGVEERAEFVNDKFIELFGYTIQDIPDVAHWWPLAYPDKKYREEIRREWEARVEQAFQNKAPFEPLEATVVCKDGSRRHVEFCLSSVGEKQLVTFVDLTERKRVEDVLTAREMEFRNLAESSPGLMGTFYLRPDGSVCMPYSSPQIQNLFGLRSEDVVDDAIPLLARTHPDDVDGVNESIAESARTMTPWHHEYRILHPTRGELWLEGSTNPKPHPDGGVIWYGFVHDITDRKRAEEELQRTNDLLGAIIEAAPTAIIGLDLEGKVQNVWNPAAEKMLGWSAREVMGRYLPTVSVDQEDEFKKFREWIRSGMVMEGVEVQRQRRGGTPIDYSIYASPLHDAQGQITGNIAVLVDITERKRAEEQRKNYLRFLESMDKVNRAMQSANDLEWIMSDVLDVVLSVFDCDRAYLLYPCDPDAPSWSTRAESTRPEYPGALALGIDEVPMDPEVAETFRLLLNTEGPVTFGPGNSHPLPADVSERFGFKSFMSMAFYPKMSKPWQFGIHQCSYARIWTSEDERLFHEIGRRLSDVLTVLLTHRHLRESEERYRQLVNLSPDAIAIFSQGRIVFANPATVKIVGAKSEKELIERSILDFIHPDFRESVMEQMARLTTGVSTPFIEEKFLRLDGLTVDVEVGVVSYQREGVDYLQIVARDITERKRHEREREAIIAVSTALRRATTQTDILNVILDQLIDLFKADGTVLVLPNSQTEGYIDEMGRGPVGERMIGLNIPPEKGVANWVIKNKKPYLSNRVDDDPLFYRHDLLGDSHCLVCVPLIAQEQAIGALWVARRTDIMEQELRLLNAIADIAANAIHRVRLHEQTEQQLHHLIALHQIDLAISANFDLNVTLNVILKNVRDELEVDAASVLLLDTVTHTLDYAAGTGFRTRRIEQSHVRLGDGCAGRSAQEYRTVSYPNLNDAPGVFSRSSLLIDEEFLSHYATPLIVKGQVKGVLEIFHRKTFDPEQEWIDYFETLATQAAIAIESASLFENLQRSNMELVLAYDATIEGWSRALDLRDRETEGHTQRVTEMVLSLAEKMGMSDAEKLDLRRGALLHDIGKMGVPDSILLKPGSLSESEWEIMRQHPFYAFQMLSPIPYLKHALDIPYCHHEKWDGSGYPRRLKGEEIPLSARLFAVVDVFDALTSDRPYRAAWAREHAQRYIQEQAGRHFDPRVVKTFLDGT